MREAAARVAARAPSERVLVVAPTLEAGSRVLRHAAGSAQGGGVRAAFGWQRVTLGEMTARLASVGLAAAGLTAASQVVLDAVCARTIHALREQGLLGRYAKVGDRPGLPRALARTFLELGLAGVGPSHPGLPEDLARCFSAYRVALADAGLADRAGVLTQAIARAERPAAHPLLDVPLILLDPPVESALEREFFAALARRGAVTALTPTSDALAQERLEAALEVHAEELRDEPDGETRSSLARLRRHLFQPEVSGGAPLDETVELISAPGESRECVEIARRVLRAAAEGVPFDRMAVLTHAPERYRAHLFEAFRRASVPAWFSRGSVAPDPRGRALLALLSCREAKLSARAFAEYLSLGVVPDPDEQGAPPEARRDVPWLVPLRDDDRGEPLEPEPDDVQLHRSAAQDAGSIPDADRPVTHGNLRVPARWERLLIDASVIDADRWRRRLEGLATRLDARIAALDEHEPRRESVQRERRDLDHLMAFALPLIDELARLPETATWGEWAEHLGRLARRAIREPERVLAVLAELGPMAPIGPVGLTEVQLVLGPRLTQMRRRPSGAPAGQLFVGSTAEARGMSFEVVFVPGLVERVFPRKMVEDPICLDAQRCEISDALATEEERVARERLALHLAIGAAEARVVLSYPRLDTERGRARVPSFYALEILRAVEGALPSFEALGRRAEAASDARMAWPAPRDPSEAIDAAEFDLAVLDELLRAEQPTPGGARYLLDTDTNHHLARALRARYARWQQSKWTSHDGLVCGSEQALAALAAHAPSRRAYSATALEQLALCPYRFYLRSVVKLTPRLVPDALEQLDPLTRGNLMHQAQHDVLHALRERGALPVTSESLPEARAVLDEVLVEVAARFREQHAPAIMRVFDDAVQDARSDLVEWLARAADRPDWVPIAFELAFGVQPREGVTHDPASHDEPVVLQSGLTLRGAIDLVERRGDTLRATDYKTGLVPDMTGPVTDGGRSLQRVLYALALEVLMPEREVLGGRLYYCTVRGRFEQRFTSLSETARGAVATIAEVLEASIKRGFLPALPQKDACARCEYRAVCGPEEERRVERKKARATAPFQRIRRLP